MTTPDNVVPAPPGLGSGCLTNEEFSAGVTCPKRLWWLIHDPLAAHVVPGHPSGVIRAQVAAVKALACDSVPRGVRIEESGAEHRLLSTRARLATSRSPIFDAAFHGDGILINCDILERSSAGIALIEVAASTTVEPELISALAVKAHVLESSGFEVRQFAVMHLNENCRYPDLGDLFTRTDCTTLVEERRADVVKQISRIREAMVGPLPMIEPGSHCWSPHRCAFQDRCLSPPEPGAIEYLYGPYSGQVAQLVAKGYRSLADIPSQLKLSSIQARQRLAVQRGGWVIEAGLRDALMRLEFPIAFLQFGAVEPVVPVWTGCRPWEPIPVQVSVHVQCRDGSVSHRHWIAEGPEDPRRDLAARLIELTSECSTVLVYDASVGAARIQELKDQVPEHAAALGDVLNRVVDLLPIVREHVYHPRMRGNFGIKHVASVLTTDMTPKASTPLGDDEISALLFDWIFSPDRLAGVRKEVRDSLMEHGKADTLSMFLVLDRLRQLADLADT